MYNSSKGHEWITISLMAYLDQQQKNMKLRGENNKTIKHINTCHPAINNFFTSIYNLQKVLNCQMTKIFFNIRDNCNHSDTYGLLNISKTFICRLVKVAIPYPEFILAAECWSKLRSEP
uniref:Uncharacterized protein n=1 Tax=Rhizophora mucronata TaxID=61149 RepID=A0A2P2QWM1_RHIMU